eukprot:CAMPEP_0180243956 /NCGR_PEP_ID=MMETSP0987-20121128/34128_1 /TAXON_ID=697907 /ORGANISM="non described non described, Strain CCMP2293" /LENGTH=39 /DNA_ID= /DNA_START= /DNA_END= /DNA_ORIENTATION=
MTGIGAIETVGAISQPLMQMTGRRRTHLREMSAAWHVST